MTITEFRDKHQPTMDEMTLAAGRYLEEQGLRFGKDFVTGDALELAASALTRQMTNAARDELNQKTLVADVSVAALGLGEPNRFEDDDWEERWGPHDYEDYT